MKYFRRLLLILFMLLSIPIQAEIVVVINIENDLKELNKEEVIGLFMGRNSAFPNGESALPFDHPAKSDLRNNFYLKLTNKTSAQINAYWARLVFSGRATPPRVLGDLQAIMSTVRINQGAIAYIDSKDLDSTVKVVYRFN